MRNLIKQIAGRLPRDELKERQVLKVALMATPAALLMAAAGASVPGLGLIGPLTMLTIDVLIVIYVRRLPRLLFAGALGGGVAGLITLGMGSRLAMRVVALLGGRREVTVEGTMFLLVAGVMVGAILGLAVAAALRVWPGAIRSIGTTVGFVLFAGLVLDSVAFEELLHEGPGGWVNFPMFFAFLMAYGWFAPRLIARVEQRLPRWNPEESRDIVSVQR